MSAFRSLGWFGLAVTAEMVWLVALGWLAWWS
jgi:hypothetical protein